MPNTYVSEGDKLRIATYDVMRRHGFAEDVAARVLPASAWWARVIAPPMFVKWRRALGRSTE